MLLVLLAILGMVGGFLSGLLGIGGAVVMIPLMLVVPKLFGCEPLSMHTVAGLSMVQVLFSSVAGVLRHHRNQTVCKSLLVFLGSAVAIGSLIGSHYSRHVSHELLLIVFGTMAGLAAAMMLAPLPKHAFANPSPELVRFPRWLAIACGLIVGGLAGMVGAGGGFLLIPVMIYILRVPLRISIGTSLGLVLLGALMGFIGKFSSGQIQFGYAAALVIGAIPAAQFGAQYSKRVPPKWLRASLMTVIIATCAQVWYEIIHAWLTHT